MSDSTHGSELVDELAAVLSDTDCGWGEMCSALGFALACILAQYEDEAQRVAMADTIAARLVDAAKTGRMPGELVQ